MATAAVVVLVSALVARTKTTANQQTATVTVG